MSNFINDQTGNVTPLYPDLTSYRIDDEPTYPTLDDDARSDYSEYTRYTFRPSAPPPDLNASNYYLNNEARHPVHQVYLKTPSLMQLIRALPKIDIDWQGIQILKGIENNASKGLIPGSLLALTTLAKIITKMAISIIVATTLTIVCTALAGFPIASTVFAVAVLPVLAGSIVGAIGGKISTYMLKYLRKEWIQYSFNAEMKNQHQVVTDVKKWTTIKDLQEIKENFQYCKRFSMYLPYHGENLDLDTLIQKIYRFQQTEKFLNAGNCYPLLHQLLYH